MVELAVAPGLNQNKSVPGFALEGGSTPKSHNKKRSGFARKNILYSEIQKVKRSSKYGFVLPWPIPAAQAIAQVLQKGWFEIRE